MTIPQLLRRWAETTPDAPALAAPGRQPLDYRQLADQTDAACGQLRSLGIGPRDRVAIVHPNGPELAAAFLAVSSAAVCAPLNPTYRESEFDFYLADLNASAIVLAAGEDSRLRELAHRRHLRILDVVATEGSPAGAFRFSDGRGRAREPAGRRHGARPPHVGDDRAAEDRAAHSPSAHPVRGKHRVDAGADAARSLPQRHAVVPHPRACGGAAVVAVRRRHA